MNLSALLNRPDLWRARDGAGGRPDTLSSGFDKFDAALHHGGWPSGGLCELLCRPPCPQTLRLLLPALARLPDGLIMLAGPPARPSARALAQAGLDLSRLLVMRGEKSALLRACRESAASGAFAALLLWWPRGSDPRDLRRLQLAARQGNCWISVIRPEQAASQASPAPLRITLRPASNGDLQLEVLKQPGGRAGQQLSLSVLPQSLRVARQAGAEMPLPDVMKQRAQPATAAVIATPQPARPQPQEAPIYRLGQTTDCQPPPVLQLPVAQERPPAAADPAPMPGTSRKRKRRQNDRKHQQVLPL